MRIIDEKFKTDPLPYLLQPAVGVLTIGLLMLVSETVLSLPIIASLGATMFIVVTAPRASATQARHLIGGYLCGIAGGLVAWLLGIVLPGLHLAVLAALAVGIALFTMVIGDFEHPPACALALCLVLASSPVLEAVLALFCVLLMSASLHFLRPYMRNLL
jgi:CBS-domain-containing membrane protein